MQNWFAPTLYKTNFKHAELSGADLTEASLEEAELGSVEMDGAKLIKPILEGSHDGQR